MHFFLSKKTFFLSFMTLPILKPNIFDFSLSLKMDSNTWTNWKKTIRTELKKRDESTKQTFNKYLNEIKM